MNNLLTNACSVGALLYIPAVNTHAADHILNHDWPGLRSVALCLEDSVADSSVEQAEAQLVETLKALSAANPVSLPGLYVRVRTPEQLISVAGRLGGMLSLLSGFIFPKFDTRNAEAWLAALGKVNRANGLQLYAMPILESRRIADISTRAGELSQLREILLNHQEEILNIRVGGNDFCNIYGLRRSIYQSIYDITVVRNIFADIINVFSDCFIVSGPVWEYFGSDPHGAWAEGLRRELELDLVNGFIGKTAIHPSQLPIIQESLKVSAADAADASRILNWKDANFGVEGSYRHDRMNELKTHGYWAEKILIRSEIYGIREDENENLV